MFLSVLSLTFLQPIEARGNRRRGVFALGREDVAEEGVFVCDQRRLVVLLGVGVVLESDRGGHRYVSLVILLGFGSV
jgi:hypothetical protein